MNYVQLEEKQNLSQETKDKVTRKRKSDRENTHCTNVDLEVVARMFCLP